MLIVMVAVSACAKKPVMDAEPAAAQETPAVTNETAGASTSATMTTLTGAQLATVYFEYDSYVLSDAAKQALADNAKLLLQATDLAIIIEGHCDERGSDEYNLALGAQRADSVKTYLQGLGVGTERLKTISFGEERPAIDGHDESAWAKNRRAAFN